MAAKPNVPNIQKSANAYNPANLQPGRIIENAPTSSLSQALANAKRQVDAAR